MRTRSSATAARATSASTRPRRSPSSPASDLRARGGRRVAVVAPLVWLLVQRQQCSEMAPRALWTGSVTFGLVNVPVRIYSAVHEHKLSFNLVHEKDDSPIGYQKICKLEDKPVPNDEIVKAYEFKKGEYVQLTDEDFAAVQVEGQHTIDLQDFVPYEDIDPVFFAHTYLVGPQDGGEKTYALLVRAMEKSGLVGIGKFVM